LYREPRLDIDRQQLRIPAVQATMAIRSIGQNGALDVGAGALGDEGVTDFEPEAHLRLASNN
jgi:hypothetical protein